MNRVFSVAKRLLPKISETEMIALRSGTVSLDRNIMANNMHETNKKVTNIYQSMNAMQSKNIHNNIINY